MVYQVVGDEARAWLVRCNSWNCETCAPLRRRKLQGMARAGNPNMFMTLTTNPHTGQCAFDRARAMTKGWHKLTAQIKRKLGIKSLEYIAVIEQTKRGEPHMHVLLRSKYIDQAWLSTAWENLTGARIVHIRRVDDPGRATAYVSKYMSKTPMRFGRGKRYFRSRLYIPKAAKPADADKWKSATTNTFTIGLAELMKLMAECGWTLTSSSVVGASWTRPAGAGPALFSG